LALKKAGDDAAAARLENLPTRGLTTFTEFVLVVVGFDPS
jgi:hypothetical protein